MTTTANSNTETTSYVAQFEEALEAAEQARTRDTEQDESNVGSDPHSQHGSSVGGAIFNFTNSIIGAGAIGLGGAISSSGGLISIFFILFFGFLTKLSLDLVIRLSLRQVQDNHQHHQHHQHCSYEDLAKIGLGKTGVILVLCCKFLYSFGCLVAYIIVIKDNLAPSLSSLVEHGTSSHQHFNHPSWLEEILHDDNWMTWIASFFIILPLCMLRDMAPLASLSFVGVASMATIVMIVVYIFFGYPDIRQAGGSVFENWFEIRPGVLESLGTFVFTYVSQHTVHLVFQSLRPEIRTLSNWKSVSTCSLLAASTVSLSVGVFVYMTFWQATKSDIFGLYPQMIIIDVAKLLLCISMLLTFPLPFFTCRELIIVTLIHPCSSETIETIETSNHESNNENDLQEPLLTSEVSRHEEEEEESSANTNAMSVATDVTQRIIKIFKPCNWLLPEDDRQLVLPCHLIVTGKLWVIITGIAIAAPSLGDVLDLVGCATGTLIAFILPALLALRLEGYSHLACVLLVVGMIVGPVGTFYSLRKIISDV